MTYKVQGYMAKVGFVSGGLDEPNLVQVIRSNDVSGWALCVGAGTSLPIFPLWDVLVERLISRDAEATSPAELAKELGKKYSSDALIQAAADRLKISSEKMPEVIRDELYREIQNMLSPEEWSHFVRALSTTRPGDLRASEWEAFLNLSKAKFSGASAVAIAEVISELIETKSAPSAILSFNAEPFLFALINAFTTQRFVSSPDNSSVAGERKQHLDIVTRSTSNRNPQRIPYIFCHGLLPVPGTPNRSLTMQSPENLVFSEDTYLRLANTNYAWQSSSFIDVCSTRTTVFVGVSFSDSNMRRWLSWIHANRLMDLREEGKPAPESAPHYWISKAPQSELQRRWIESSVAHLGIRLIWVKDYTFVGQVLRQMTGRHH